MKKLNKVILIIVIAIIAAFCINNVIFAKNGSSKNQLLNAISKETLEYTDEFKEWLKLSKEEQSNTYMPRMYDFPKTEYVSTNPLNIVSAVGSTYISKYNLKDIIPDNVIVRDQKSTGFCWAFADIAALETNLALTDYYNNSAVVKYDFSERHMAYGVTRTFLNNEINKYGINKSVGSGGNSFMALFYLTNGLGPVDESQMPFEDTEETIDISLIQNKEVSATIYDFTNFSDYSDVEDKTEIKNKMKEYIKQYGGISAGIYGADPIFDDYCNKDTGAIYCDDSEKCKVDHEVLIIGWDDDYSIDNFADEHKPKNKGAWIIKNSWGEELKYSFEELKEITFEAYESIMKERYGINSASEIPDEFIVALFETVGFEQSGNYMRCSIGDNGIMYVSYDDVNIYSSLTGIDKAVSEKDYDNIYQYNYNGYDTVLSLTPTKAYIANKYTRDDTSQKEYLTRVGISLLEATTCKVYVNLKDDSKSMSDLEMVELKAGDSETLDPGYHSLEFAEPLEITGSEFVVVVEYNNVNENGGVHIAGEAAIADTDYDSVEISSNTCFWSIDGAIESNQWVDLSTMNEFTSGTYSDMDSTIKAFTINEVQKVELSKIEITTPPNKTEYVEGQDFETTGMIVKATYSDNSTQEITDYTIENGTNLTVGQTEVIIKYNDKTATQKITVTAKKDDTTDTSQAEATDFTNATAKADTVKAYYYTDTSKKELLTMNLVISNIERKDNDSTKYYYYISDNASAKNITDWTQASISKDEKACISFYAKVSEMSNYGDLIKAGKLYVYVKEIATKGTSEVTTTSNSILIDGVSTIEIYKDGVKQTTNSSNNTNSTNTTNNTSNNSTKNTTNNNSSKTNTTTTSASAKNYTSATTTTVDNTTSTSPLPKTGLKITVKLILFGIIAIGFYCYNKYRKMEF